MLGSIQNFLATPPASGMVAEPADFGASSLPGNPRGNPCPYARSGGRLQEAATICRVRHDRDSCEPAAPALNGPPRVIPACMIGPSVILPPEASGVAWRRRPPLSAVRLVSRRPRALASCASGRHRTFDSTARWQAVEPLLQREYRKCRRRCPQRCYRDGTDALAGALVLGAPLISDAGPACRSRRRVACEFVEVVLDIGVAVRRRLGASLGSAGSRP